MRSLLVLPLVVSVVVVGSAQRAPEPAPKQPASRQSAPRAPQPAPASAAAGFDTIVKPFLSQNCFPCHGNKKHEKDLNFQSFDSDASLVEHRDRWDEVVRKLRRGEMPPLEEEQPPEEQRQAVAAWSRASWSASTRPRRRIPGRVTARRLNRTEYNNTIRDLLGVDMRPADDFPQDDSGYGFDNIADVLSLSPVLMEKYVAAAERVARVALFGPPPLKPTLDAAALGGPQGQETRDRPGDVRRDRPQPAERLPRHVSRPGRRRVRHPRRASAGAARRDPMPIADRAVGRRKQVPGDARSGGPAPFATIGRTSAARPFR